MDPVNGKDTNEGTQTKPFKTLIKALGQAQAGDTVKFAGGGYGPAASSGEQSPASGLVVPSGVTIEGALDSGFPISTLVGTGGGVELNFAGNATLRNLFFGGASFGVGLFAKQGKQTLSNVFLGMPGSSAVEDGAQLSGGIVLRGTTQATLLPGASGANTTGSTISLNVGTGVNVFEQAAFTMEGGRIAGVSGNCATSGDGIALHDAVRATLNNVVLQDIPGNALDMRDTAQATLTATTITRRNASDCAPAPSVFVVNSAALATTEETDDNKILITLSMGGAVAGRAP